MEMRFHGPDNQRVPSRSPDIEKCSLEERRLVGKGAKKCLNDLDIFVVGMNDALAVTPVSVGRDALCSGVNLTRRTAFWLALPFIVVFMGHVVVPGEGPALSPVAVLQLSAMRVNMVSLTAAREIDLTLDDAGVLVSPRVQVVDHRGKTEWAGAADRSGSAAHVRIPRSLNPGDYCVWLYDSKGKAVQEYDFHVR